MAYVLNYTVIPARGEPRVVEAIGHAHALASVVKGMLGLATARDSEVADYEPADGEEITVTGPAQEEWANRFYAEHRHQDLEKLAAQRTKKAGDVVTPVAARQMLASFQWPPEAKIYVVKFRLNLVTRVQVEYLDGLPEETEEAA